MKAITTILTIFILTSISEQLFACSCQGERTVQEEVKYADAVFVGTVISKELTMKTDSAIMRAMTTGNSPMPTVAKYSLLVEYIYKGEITSDTITIFTGLGGGDCGVRFEIGEKYIVYGKSETYFGGLFSEFQFPKGVNIFWTHTCMRTNLFRQEEINEIEKYTTE
jgi:hypothetical protein